MSGAAVGNAVGDSASTTSTAPAPKRLRVSRACEQCRSRKAKCDGQVPTCSTCASLNQPCTLGPPPKRRGLPAGSFSTLEKTVKLYEKLLGSLFINVPESEQVIAGLVRRHAKVLLDDGADGEALLKSWKEGSVVKVLDAVQNAGPEEPGRGDEISASLSPSLDVAQQLFHDAMRTLPFNLPPAVDQPSGEKHYALRDFGLESGMDWLGQQDPAGDYGQGQGLTVDPLEDANGARSGGRIDASYTGQVDIHNSSGNALASSASLALDPLLMEAGIGEVDNGNTSNLANYDVAQHQQTSTSPTPQHFPSFPSQQQQQQPSIPARPHLHGRTSFTPQATYDVFTDSGLALELPKNSKLLLDLYFAYTHVWLPILDKYEIIRIYHALNLSTKPSRNLSGTKQNSASKQQEVSPSDKGLLYSVLALASLQHVGLSRANTASNWQLSQPGSGTEEASATSDLYLASQNIAFAAGRDKSLPRIQSLLLLSLFNLCQDQISTAWSLVGHAGRLAVEMELHNNNTGRAKTSKFGARTWLGYIVLEVFLCNKLGRQPAYTTWDFSSVEEDGWEEWDSWKEMQIASVENDLEDSLEPSHILSVFNQLLGLCSIIKPASLFRSEPIRAQDRMEKLKLWASELPSYCAIDVAQLSPNHGPASSSTLPHITNLHLLYMDCLLSLAKEKPLVTHISTSPALIAIKGFATIRSLAVSPCTFLHFAERSEAKILHEQLSKLWKMRHLLGGTGILRRSAVHKEYLVKPQIQYMTPPDVSGRVDRMPQRQTQSTTLHNSGYPEDSLSAGTYNTTSHFFATTPSFRPETLYPQNTETLQESPIDVIGVSVPSPSILFNLPPSGHQRHNSAMTAIEHDRRTSSGGQPQARSNNRTMSQSQSHTAPSPDTHDEEMGMLECLPWAQDQGIPEFMQNLGYIGDFGGFSTTNNAQMPLNGVDGHSQPGFGYSNQNPNQLMPFDQYTAGNQARNFDTPNEEQPVLRPTLNPVLEQWLGDMLVAGNGGLRP